MMSKPVNVYAHKGYGFEVVHEDEAWRVGLMNWCAQYSPDQITAMQRHENCDEVFVLLKGRCALLTLQESGIEMVDLQPDKVYNVHKGVWHNHVLDAQALVLVVENRDMDLATSPYLDLDEVQRKQVERALAKLDWTVQS